MEPVNTVKESLPQTQTVETSDYYEAAYYTCCGFIVQKVEIIKEARITSAKFTIKGEGLSHSQITYFNGLAVVNLL